MDVADVEDAARRIAGRVRRTPLVPVEGTPLLAKCESLQETGSFKLRGATNAVLALAHRGVVTSSSRNHGRALAAAARRLGVPATVVMTTDSSPFKRAATEAIGARIVECAPGTAARARASADIVESEGLTFVPPYDHPLVIAGQGTVGLEIVEDLPDVTAVVAPLGGGGLLSGVATAVKARAPQARVVGVEPEDAACFARSLAAGRRTEVGLPTTICDGARTQIPGELTFPIVAARVDEVISVSDAEVVDAVRLLASAGLVVEPTAALAVAGARALGLSTGTVCVVSGRNIAAPDYAGLLAR